MKFEDVLKKELEKLEVERTKLENQANVTRDFNSGILFNRQFESIRIKIVSVKDAIKAYEKARKLGEIEND